MNSTIGKPCPLLYSKQTIPAPPEIARRIAVPGGGVPAEEIEGCRMCYAPNCPFYIKPYRECAFVLTAIGMASASGLEQVGDDVPMPDNPFVTFGPTGSKTIIAKSK